MLHNRYIKWSFILICFVFFVSCSGDKGQVSSPHFDGEYIKNSNGKILSECSNFQSRMGPTIHALMKSYEQNGYFDPDQMRLRFTQNIDLRNKVLVFFRWRQDANGNYSADDSFLKFDIHYSDGRTPQTNRDNISHSETENTPLTSMTITLKRLPVEYQALQIAIFDNNNNGDIYAYADGLLPRFEAHPRYYNESHRSQNLLQELHPYRSESSSTKPQEEFANRSYQDFCF